jgi:hypothetical protein
MGSWLGSEWSKFQSTKLSPEIVKVERCDQIEGEPDLDSFCRHTKPGEELVPESESQILPLYGSGSSGLLSSQSPVHQDLDLCAAVFCPT